MRKVVKTSVTAAIFASLIACGGGRSPKAIKSAKTSGEADATPGEEGQSDDTLVPGGELSYPQQNSASSGSVGNLDAYLERQRQLEAYNKQLEQNSPANMAAQLLPQILSGFMGGTNPLQGLMSGLMGPGNNTIPQQPPQQQTPQQQTPPGPNQAQMMITDPLPAGLGSFYGN